MVRTQLYLDEALHQRLRDLADRQGRTISDLVREAIVRAYGSTIQDDPRYASLEGIVSLWRDRRDLGTAGYVRRLRRDTRRRRPE